MDAGSIVDAILIVVLICITAFYAWQTKRLVRDDRELMLYVADPMDREWEKDTSRIDENDLPKSNFLRVKALLVNPGSSPIVVTEIEESIKDKNGKTIKGRSILPKISSSDRYGLYIYAMPWVIVHDDFSIWYRVFEVDDNKGSYLLRILMKYQVGSRTKSVTKEIQLTSHSSKTENI